MIECVSILCVFCRYLQLTDSLTITVWNHRKVHRREGAGFLGSVRLLPSALKRLFNVGCKSPHVMIATLPGVFPQEFIDQVCRELT